MKKEIEYPKYHGSAFIWPNCNVFSNQEWNDRRVNDNGEIYISNQNINLSVCKCQHCGYLSFWYLKKLAWPLNSLIEAPIDEIPEDIKILYNEARSFIELSPKGSCAIIRLALQKLCNRLAGQDEKKKIDGAIKKLVENGLPKLLQKAMDSIRIIGDETVHPGQINIDDNREFAVAMFRMMNIIVKKIILEPKEIDDLYQLMPENKKEEIRKMKKYN